MRCDLHDYLEIACLFTYRVSLRLENGSQRTGKPQTTVTEPGGREYLVFEDADGHEFRIPLGELVSMTVLDNGARFKHIDF